MAERPSVLRRLIERRREKADAASQRWLDRHTYPNHGESEWR